MNHNLDTAEDMKYYILIITYSFPNQQILESFPESSDLQESGRFVFCYSRDDTNEVLQYIPNYQNAFEEHHRHDTAGVLIGQGMRNSIVFMTREGHPKESPQEPPKEIPADGRSHWRTLGFVRDDPPVRCLLDHSGNTHCRLGHEHERVIHCVNCDHCRLEGLIKYLLDHTNDRNTLYANIENTPWLRLFHGTAHLEHNDQNSLAHLLSGRLAIFWGLVALNIGENIQELERYFHIHDHQLCLNTPTPQFDRTSGRAVAVTIYRDPIENTALETVEATWQLA